MKKSKLSRIAALLAAGALLLGGVFMSCSSGDNNDEEPTPQPSGGGGTADTSGVTDSLIKIEYTDTPKLASSGNAYIYNGKELVDTISVTGESLYGISSSKGVIGEIKVDDQLITVEDNYVVIVPHNNSSGYSVLSPSTTYTVVLDDGLVTGTRVSSGDITFTTRSKQTPANNTITVGSSDSANFYTLQGALNYIRASESTESWTINVEEGKYHELLFYYGSANVTIAGPASDNYGDKAYVYWRNNQNMGNSQRSRQSFIWQGGNLTIKNMTFENTSNRTVEGNTNVQAETLYFDCKADLVVHNSSFSSYQDTLLLGNNGGRAWFYKCLVEGDVDFIWGYADVALFEECKIVCRADGIKDDAKIFASRTVVGDTAGKGFVLMNSDVVIQDGCSAAYGRTSGGPDTQAAVFNNTFVTEGSGTLYPALWGSPSDTRVYEPNEEMAVGYKDRNNTLNGTLVDTSSRLKNTAGMSERICNREYNGRWTILNRQYNLQTEAYETKSSIWDISAYETEFNATADTSKENIYVEPVYSKNIVGGLTVQLSASTTSSSSLTYTYESSDSTSLASVDENGLVTTVAGADGTITIIATGSNGKTDIAQIKVIPTKVDVASISFDAPESVDAYALSTVTATFNPTDATIKTLNWTATGDIRIVDPSSKTAVTSLEESNLESVQIEGITPGGSGTLTVTSTDNTSATTTKTISISSVRDYNGAEASAVNSNDKSAGFGVLNFQGGKVGMWHDLYVHAIYEGTNGKIAASSERVQTRYGTIYIPVTASSVIDVTCSYWNESALLITDFKDYAGNAPETWEDENEATYKYHYKWELDYTTDTAKLVDGSEVKALYDEATKDTNRSWTGHEPDADSKYFAIVIPGTDRYWTHITVTEDPSIHHEAASATLEIEEFAHASKEIDLSADNYSSEYTQTTTATSSDSTEPTITYKSSNTDVATVDSSSGKVTLTGLVGSTTITATASHATDENVTKVGKSYTIKVVQSKAKESMYFDFRGTGISGTFDYGILTGTGTFHGTSYGLSSGTINVQVVGPSRIYFAQMDYGGDVTVTSKVGDADETSVGTATTKASGKCTKTVLSEAIEEGYVSYLDYKGSDAATIKLNASSYFSRFWVEKYEAPAVEISATDFASKTLSLDLNGTKTSGSQTITATVSDNSTATIAYSSSYDSVATVNSSTGEVTAVGIGRSLITATVTASDAEKVEKTYVVTVKNSATPTEGYSIDFASGNIYDGKTVTNDVDLGIVYIKAGNSNGLGYNGQQHGITFKAGNNVTLSVKASSVITLTNCAYDSAYTLSVTSDSTTITDVAVGGTNSSELAGGSVSIPAGDQTNDGKTTTITIPSDFTGNTVTLTHSGKTAYLHKIDVTIPTDN